MMDTDMILLAEIRANNAAKNFHSAFWLTDRDQNTSDYLREKAVRELIEAVALFGYTVTKIEPVAEAAE